MRLPAIVVSIRLLLFPLKVNWTMESLKIDLFCIRNPAVDKEVLKKEIAGLQKPVLDCLFNNAELPVTPHDSVLKKWEGRRRNFTFQRYEAPLVFYYMEIYHEGKWYARQISYNSVGERHQDSMSLDEWINGCVPKSPHHSVVKKWEGRRRNFTLYKYENGVIFYHMDINSNGRWYERNFSFGGIGERHGDSMSFDEWLNGV